jgi:hypothetical protein
MIFSLVKYERIRLPDYTYPLSSELIGWFLALSSMICIPVYAIYKWVITEGTFTEVRARVCVCTKVEIEEILHNRSSDNRHFKSTAEWHRRRSRTYRADIVGGAGAVITYGVSRW